MGPPKAALGGVDVLGLGYVATAGTFPNSSVSAGGSGTINFSITATDASLNSSTVSAGSVTIFDCP